MKASENTVKLVPLMMFSQMPMINAPITAPGIEPMPPKTAATKAFNPGIAPDKRHNLRVVREVKKAADCSERAAYYEGEANDGVYLDAHELAGLKVLGGCAHGQTYLCLVDKYLQNYDQSHDQEGGDDSNPAWCLCHMIMTRLAEERDSRIALRQAAGVICGEILN